MNVKDKKFLERARELKFNSKLDKSGKKIAAVLFKKLFPNQFRYKIKQREIDLETILANLIYSETPVLLPMRANYWAGQDIKYQTIKSFKQILEQEGYIDIKNGFYDHTDKNRSRYTRIWATPKLRNSFKNVSIYSGNSFDLIELKTRMQRDRYGKIKKDKNGNDLLLKKSRKIPFKETGRTMKLRRALRKINKLNNNANIKLFHKDKWLTINVSIKAVFTESFAYHGRLYANGINQFQQFSKEDRKRILINGLSVIELDYSGLHPRLLYALEGIPFNEDPYTIVNSDPIVRTFQKIMLLSMINCKGFNEAQAACNSWLNPEYEQDRDGNYKIDLSMTKQQKIKFEKHCKKATSVKEIGIMKAGPLMKEFLRVHEPISKYLCTGNKTGMKLMNKDGKISLDVCEHFIKKNIPILPIHDSFIVPARYEHELREVMAKIYRKHTKGFQCPIK